jgi:hypothetical protein|eukprot:2625715-Prymnesium_polylepis.1
MYFTSSEPAIDPSHLRPPTARSVPVLYSSLLWASRDALRSGNPSALSEATAFLSGDYALHAFFWEVEV